MKRPAGPAARPAASPTPPRTPEPRQEPARGPAKPAAGRSASRSSAASRAEPEALTEPIALPTGDASDSPASDSPASGTPASGTSASDARTPRLRPGSFSLPKRGAKAAAGGTVLALVAFVLVGVFSPLMALRTIEITGTNRIPAADVAQALEGQLGTPLPLLDLAEVKGQLSEFSLIRSYVTESRPPDTLVVRIVEREPVGAIPSAAGIDLVDAAGVVIQSGPDRPPGYPLIDAADGASGAGFQAGVAVVGALPEGIRGQLDTVTAATKDDVTLTLGGGARVVWGNAERSEYKALVLAALLVSHPVGSVTEYDVSSPDSAVVR